jgi:hypothetical protein
MAQPGVLTVPNVVGLPFSLAVREAITAGVTLANPNPDGPPIGALAWGGDFVVVSQEPPAGTTINVSESVRVVIEERGGDPLVGARRLPPDPPPHLVAHAEPDEPNGTPN